MKADTVSFSFGKNWLDYIKNVSDQEVESAKEDILKWLGNDSVAGKTVLDIGCGSGVHSLAFHKLGAEKILSFDYDQYSVEATKILWEKAGKPEGWSVTQGSIVDDQFIKSLGQYDIVYVWGVLPFTGSLWDGFRNCISLLKPGGVLWTSIYAKGNHYPRDLAMKKKYNAATKFGKRLMVYKKIAKIMIFRLIFFKNPFTWNAKRGRGMDAYHDLLDWLGGLPYEVASEDEVLQFGGKFGLALERIQVNREGSCSIYVFRAPLKN